MEMMIGADELILWLRKNKKAGDLNNATLGHKIKKVMLNFGGKIEKENYPSIWVNDINPVAADKLTIPMTSSYS